MTKTKKTTGMLLGKFMPPHQGHLTLARFAAEMVDELTIVVGSLKAEPIAGDLRYQWMTEEFPNCNIVHLTDENPQLPEEHPDFWQIWHDSLMRVLPSKPDFVFAGEDYGAPLAETLGATFIPAPDGRDALPISATMIREKPITHWDMIAPAARPYFLKRFTLIGAETTGKSSLAKSLATHYSTVYVPEYAYSYIRAHGSDLNSDDFIKIAEGQAASETALARQARGILISDTNTLMTELWAEELLGHIPDGLTHAPNDTHIFLCMPDGMDWQDDIHRYSDVDRNAFHKKILTRLNDRNIAYTPLSGTWDERLEKATETIDRNI